MNQSKLSISVGQTSDEIFPWTPLTKICISTMAGSAVAYARTTVVSRKKTPKAKCEANQVHVDKISAKREQVGSNNYSYTLKRAMDSIVKHKEPITTYQQAIKLQYVGPKIAQMICPSTENDETASLRTKRQNSSSQPSPSTSSTSSSQPLQGAAPKRRRKLPPQDLRTILEKPSAKEVAYQRAVQNAQQWKQHSLTWKVVLLIDRRERQYEHMIAKCQMSGIPCQERSLPIGDMAWIAQGMGSGKVQVELMLGTIVERKTVEDLRASLFGTRYNEQQLRLKHSGIPQVLFLIEGDLSKELVRCPAETLHTTTWAIRLHKGFQIVQTAHMDETVLTLKRMHRRILQRSFPAAFYDEALPTFAEPDAVGHGRRDSHSQQQRHRRRRLKSLMEMSFDVDPVPMPGMERFVTYQELKTKVERDRETGTRTVGSIHAAMLKQVWTFSSKKVQAVSRAYSTANQLFRALEQETSIDKKKTLVADLPIQDPEAGGASRKIGPRSAEEIYVAYGTGATNRRESMELSTSRLEVVAQAQSTGTASLAAEPSSAAVALPMARPTAPPSKKPPSSLDTPLSDILGSGSQNVGFEDEGGRRNESKLPAASKPLCVDLLSSDDEGTAKKPTARGSLDVSFGQSPGPMPFDSSEDDRTPCAPKTMSTGQKQTDPWLNWSMGTSSSGQSSKENVASRKPPPAYSIDSSDDETSPLVAKRAPAAKKRTVDPDLNLSLDSSDEGDAAQPLNRDLLSGATGVCRQEEKTATSQGLSQATEVIEID